MQDLIDRLERERTLEARQMCALIDDPSAQVTAALAAAARRVRDAVYGRAVFVRGLIEFTSFCKNDCLYCGLRRSNRLAGRYRLSPEEILSCCQSGYAAGMRTFVLQGGEDAYFTRERVARLVSQIKRRYPDCAVTLSIGECSEEDLRAFRRAGAERYLLRHETATRAHYAALHPPEMCLASRMACLRALRAQGYAVGCGMMVGSPGQTTRMLARDVAFLRAFAPEMAGIGPFIPHAQTPFASRAAGSVETTLRLLSIVRLTLPWVLLPATTALSTLDGDGHLRGMEAGANVVMLNLTPPLARRQYALYDGKADCPDDAHSVAASLAAHLAQRGYFLSVGRGDCAKKAP